MYSHVFGMYSHVFTVFTRVSKGPNPACAESACIVLYRACPNWGAGIHRYRKVSPVSCIEYVSRGPRFTHFFKTCEIREIHARYQGKKMEEYRITIPVKKRAIHYDTWYWGKTDPIFGGNRTPIHYRKRLQSSPHAACPGTNQLEEARQEERACIPHPLFLSTWRDSRDVLARAIEMFALP